ncbi:polyphosphate--glucose phosphotransferase [Bifidobacterium samirii]|uniref:Polyphosphate glucokinase n=1 Tax=Bifidobacterium samirii TaxID=2306974 RepID=A0A430FTW9_9BIFI|nr:ROK family protein [Bifidobacterium samirii]RSX56379.1 polyphosphate glucokinase [Bifidobacterium samirii]
MIETAQAFGVDIGGSGIKAAPVNLEKGEFAEPRLKILTPEVSTPQAVAAIVRQQLEHFDVPADVPVGIAFPAPIKPGQKLDFMANLDQSWIGVDVTEVFSEACGRPVVVVNDADAAGLAEQQYGAAKGQDGLVIATTLGTGIGTALIYNGVLIPNTELGHIELAKGKGDAEKYASSGVREREELSYKKWAKRLTKYYGLMEKYFSPELFVVGGGVSRQSAKFLPHIDIKTPIVPAKLRNEAGIVGAAYYASTKQ